MKSGCYPLRELETPVQALPFAYRPIRWSRNHSGIRLAVLLSLLVHAAAGWYALAILSPHIPEARSDTAAAPLIARLAPAARVSAPASVAAPSPALPSATPPARPLRAPTPRKTIPAKAVPPPDILSAPPLSAPAVVAAPPLPEPEPAPSPVAPVSIPTPPQRIPPQVADLSAYIALQRRAIGDPDLNTGLNDGRGGSAAEIDNKRRDNIIANNLAGTRHQGTGYDQGSGGGIFRIRRLGSDDAEFWFAGFNRDMERRTQQIIEVRRGDSPDIHVAVVRKMIAIIRDEVQGDFRWQSVRLGRDIWLSARLADDDELQATLMRELFPDWSAQMRR